MSHVLHKGNRKTPWVQISGTSAVGEEQHGSPVAKHFLSAGHDEADMLVSEICAGFAGNTLQRRHAEARLIFRHKTMHPKGMNVDFAFV